MSRSTGGMGNIYRYACIIDPGQQEKEGCPAPRGGRGETCGTRPTDRWDQNSRKLQGLGLNFKVEGAGSGLKA